MSHEEDWLTKKFNFDSPTSDYNKFMDFLRETPKKVESLVNGLPAEVLTRRDGDSWSIQENVGHFLTVESLFLGRMEDYQKNAEVLRPARFEDNPTGTFIPLKASVFLLISATTCPMFTPAGPSAGPSGGAADAFPPSTNASITWSAILFVYV